MRRYGSVAVTLVALLAPAISARAFGLTEADYAYLAAQDIARASAVLRGLSSREQARLQVRRIFNVNLTSI
jgi:hypothetical protein